MAAMRTLLTLPLLALYLAACATLPASRDTPYLPAGVYGMYEDNDIGAINQSAWAFSSPANTSGNPVDAAKAVIALEYLSGELRENPRWVGMDAATKLHMAQARDDLRRGPGVCPDAPPPLGGKTPLPLSARPQVGNQTP